MRYIPRAEEKEIDRVLDSVREDHESRIVLLYGTGGVGKTSLVRNMAGRRSDDRTIWLDPVDMDDLEYWLMSNLERKIANRLDEDGTFFAPYYQELSQLPAYSSSTVSHETIIRHLSKVNQAFVSSYNEFAAAQDKTVVVTFDTVEVVRGTNLLTTLAQWIKALPARTLFILAGRPLEVSLAGSTDPVAAEFTGLYREMPLVPITVHGFDWSGAESFLRSSAIGSDLVGDEEAKIIYLTRGHPLWLAFVADYLQEAALPPEIENSSLTYIKRNLRYARSMTREGEDLHDAFVRRLMTPYRRSDFWHESIKRLAVVRQPVAKPAWQMLMADCALPDDVSSLDAAWERLMELPWVRPRGDYGYVTLHDAVAEALAEWLFPVQDDTQEWRQNIWKRARAIYKELSARAEDALTPRKAALDSELEPRGSGASPDSGQFAIDRDILERAVSIDLGKRELDQLKAASLYYLFLIDFEAGCRELLDYFQGPRTRHDEYMRDMLVLYLQVFLPGGTETGAFNDVVGRKLSSFRSWLDNEGRLYYLKLGVVIAQYLIDSAQADASLELLDRLPWDAANVRIRHRVHILRGNACVGIHGRVREGLRHLDRAVAEAQLEEGVEGSLLLAEAYKEKGLYYRQTGEWAAADETYASARDVMLRAMPVRRSVQDAREIASIQTNWAYVKGLTGNYREGIELAETAVSLRRRMEIPIDEAMSLSVCGEVYRYARRFEMAWQKYVAAQEILEDRNDWARLGLIYQEQAICLHQALDDDVRLVGDPIGLARERIRRALSICPAHEIRGYPSALNRAGRIFGRSDPDAGLEYLRKGISEAYDLSDGWFWFANMIEFGELCYIRWIETRGNNYRASIDALADDIEAAATDYSFPDLSGRWSLLQGHIRIQDYVISRDAALLVKALDCYKDGFAEVARRYVGSSGAASISGEFRKFSEVFLLLPEDVKSEWLGEFRTAWSALKECSTLLLAHLENLY